MNVPLREVLSSVNFTFRHLGDSHWRVVREARLQSAWVGDSRACSAL